MKRQAEADKIYYDVTIGHDPQHKDLRYGVASKAETLIDLRDALVENPGDFNLAITKFKIDTECIPLMIPEMKQPQPLFDDKIKKANKMKTIYKFDLSISFRKTVTTNYNDKR